MKNSIRFVVALFVCLAMRPALAQEYVPKNYVFNGAPEYTTQELMDAAQLKLGVALTLPEIRSHFQTLLDTGNFADCTFTFNGQDVVFTLKPSENLFAVRLENVPLVAGKELDEKLHERVPLYHGKVPMDGTTLDGVQHALEEILTTQGLHVTLATTQYTDENLHQVTAMSFTVKSLMVVVGDIHVAASSSALDAKVQKMLAKASGTPYGTEESIRLIETGIEGYYRDKGYLEVAVHAVPRFPVVVGDDGIRVPFEISFTIGDLYKITSVQLTQGLLVSQSDFDKQSQIHPGDIADHTRVRENWEYIARQYHNKGYMQAAVHPVPAFDRAQHIVSYTVSVEPGGVYRMGNLTIENFAEDVRTAVQSSMTLKAGDIFNESAIVNLSTSSKLEKLFAVAAMKYKFTLNDEDHTVDVSLRFEKKS